MGHPSILGQDKVCRDRSGQSLRSWWSGQSLRSWVGTKFAVLGRDKVCGLHDQPDSKIMFGVLRGVARADQADGLWHSPLEDHMRLVKNRRAVQSASVNASLVAGWFTERNSSAMKAWAMTKFLVRACNTSNTLGMSSIKEISTVSICGQKGNPRSEMTRVFVCRIRQRRELMAGLRMPVLSTPTRVNHVGIPYFGNCG